MNVSGIVISCFLVAAACSPVCAGDDFPESGVVLEQQKSVGTVTVFFNALFNFYSSFVSPVDNKECIFNPTCSRFAREAIAKYGFVRAYPLISARLIRCNPSAYDKGYYPPAKRSDDIWKAYDPVP